MQIKASISIFVDVGVAVVASRSMQVGALTARKWEPFPLYLALLLHDRMFEIRHRLTCS
jgi:hypothetical protein